ncbi:MULTISPECIES: hypothetical protein [unclassified Nocardiopsis]|uniref:hypothetical protein n=1 Tax=Nocardiopsis TaxID=2013 RepID=UPI00387A8469
MGATVSHFLGWREHSLVDSAAAVVLDTEHIPAPRPNLYRAATREVTLRGMLVAAHLDRFPEFHAKAVPWLLDGTLPARETILGGLEKAPETPRRPRRPCAGSWAPGVPES